MHGHVLTNTDPGEVGSPLQNFATNTQSLEKLLFWAINTTHAMLTKSHNPEQQNSQALEHGHLQAKDNYIK